MLGFQLNALLTLLNCIYLKFYIIFFVIQAIISDLQSLHLNHASNAVNVAKIDFEQWISKLDMKINYLKIIIHIYVLRMNPVAS